MPKYGVIHCPFGKAGAGVVAFKLSESGCSDSSGETACVELVQAEVELAPYEPEEGRPRNGEGMLVADRTTVGVLEK
jgi:hypothetical protein